MKRSELELKRSELELLSTEELWVLHEKITATLNAKISAEKKVIEDRLAQLNGWFRVEQTRETPERRPYPTVFQNSEIRNNLPKPGRAAGKQPRWLTAQLKSGKPIEDFRIDLALAQAAE
jgi:DNA-binding protein H-NS